MQLNTRVRLDAARRARETCRRPGLPRSIAGVLARLDQHFDAARRFLQVQLRARSTESEARGRRARIGASLAERLGNLVRLARSVAQQDGIESLRVFPRCPAHSPGPFLGWCRTVLERVSGHDNLLCHHGLPRDLIFRLRADTDAYAAASAQVQEAERSFREANAGLDDAARTAFKLLDHLDALLRLELSDDLDFFRAWDAARAIQWSRRRSGPDQTSESDPPTA